MNHCIGLCDCSAERREDEAQWDAEADAADVADDAAAELWALHHK